MAIYAMHRLNREGTVFSTSTTSYTKDYAEGALPLYLADQLIRDENGKIRRRYRLHSDQATTIDTALTYDINCPHCGNRLRQIGRCLNSHELGLYRCPACDKQLVNTMNDLSMFLDTFEYDQNFWNALRCREYNKAVLDRGAFDGQGAHMLPAADNAKFLSYLKEESLFRRIATVFTVGNGDHTILAKDCDDLADWYAEGEMIPIYDGIRDFTAYGLGSHKLASFVKFDEPFVRDAVFNFRDYLLRRFARVMGRAEEKAFITGTSSKQPSGLLKTDSGAEVGVTTAALSGDNLVDLFFSLQPEYRVHGVWIMNDETALFLRKLKDGDGNYIWDHASDTILGKPVMTSNFMPSAEEGAIPIIFGDYSYYWVVCRRPFSVRALYERFAEFDQIGYVGVEYLDGRLVRRKAVKALQITS